MTTTYSTGFNELDDIIGKLQPGKVYVYAGRPGMGHEELVFNVQSDKIPTVVINRMSVKCMENTLRFFKETAMKLHTPVVLVCFVAQKVERRKNHLPEVSDLKYHSAFVKASDCVDWVIVPYRDNYYSGWNNENDDELSKIYCYNMKTGERRNTRLMWSRSERLFRSLTNEEFDKYVDMSNLYIEFITSE